MPTYSADDIVEQKNKEKRRKRLIKLFAIFIAAAAAVALYFTRDIWIPKLRGIGKQYKTIVNSGKLAGGNFPIETGGSESYQLKYTGEKIVLLNDNTLYFYDTDGNQIGKRQHAYTNSVLKVANGRALVYENGGDEFSLEDENGVLYSKTYDSNILFVRVSSDGCTAAVTTSDNYSCEMTVYNKKGTKIYERKCTEMVSDISFINDSSGCVLSFIKAENGMLVTSVQEINFTESKERWTSPGLNTVGLEIFGFSGGAFIYGSDACGYVDGNGQISSFYQYDGDLAAGASSGGKSAVLVNNDDTRHYTAALFSNGKNEPLIIELDAPGTDVTISDGLTYIMCQDKIFAYDFSGKLRSTATVTDSYTGFVRGEEHIFLKGYNRIDRIDYET